MKINNINIATAEISHLSIRPTYFSHRCFYFWTIVFQHSSSPAFDHSIIINAGDSQEKADIFWKSCLKIFEDFHIFDGDRVWLVFNGGGQVIAVTTMNQDDNKWLDLTTNPFSQKTFDELNFKVNI